MTKADLAAHIASRENITKATAVRFLNRLQEAIAAELHEHGESYFPCLGTFHIVERRPRRARNPKTGAVHDVPARLVVRLRPSKLLPKHVTA